MSDAEGNLQFVINQTKTMRMAVSLTFLSAFRSHNAQIPQLDTFFTGRSCCFDRGQGKCLLNQ